LTATWYKGAGLGSYLQKIIFSPVILCNYTDL
jgi:hypothetical protein